ncbi:MAG TPA: GAF domain-containing protein [Methylomirabilota bacterium]|nr:GAF domain-containing protein [Methylomirabilota bacterium]
MGQPSAPSPHVPSAGGLDLAPVAERIATSVLRLVGGRRVRLYCRLDPAAVALTPIGSAGEADAAPAVAAADAVFAERAVHERRPVYSPEAALAAVPVEASGDTVGALLLAGEANRGFTEHEMMLLTACADQMALAVEHARTQIELARQRYEAEELARVARLVNETLDLTAVGKRIASSVLELLAVPSSAIRLFRPDGSLGAIALGGRARQYTSGGDAVPAGVGLVGRAAAEGRPMWTADFRTDDRFETSDEMRRRNEAAGIVAGLAVPLRVGGKVIGVLSVGHPMPRTFTPAEIALLQTFADHAAVALANARNQEDLAKHAERLRVLHEIDRAIITETAPVAIAEAVLWRLRDLLGVPRAIVNLFDWEAGEVEWLAAVGRHRMHLGPGVRYPLSLAGDVAALRRGEPQIVDVDRLPSTPQAQALLASGVHVYMVVPMIAGHDLIGSVSFGGDQVQFSAEQVAIAQEVAAQLAIAITQARLHEQVTRQAAELEQRVAERTRALETANHELEVFTHTVSHDLKAPLRGMEGFAQALEEDFAERLDDTGRDFLSRIRASAGRMSRLIDELLQYSRIEKRPGERGAVALAPLLDELLDELAGEIQARGIRVTVDLAVGEVIGEREGLREALANLLSNAVKFSPPKDGTIAVRACREGERVVLAVADRGVGFDMQYHDRIFGIFERLHRQEEYPGTGVGLAIVRKVAERHGGRAWAESEVGRGSTFFLAIPDAPAAQ